MTTLADKNRYNQKEADNMSEEIIRYEEVSPTAKLWRYMDLAKFISLIGKKKLYFASLESFEDISLEQTLFASKT